MAVEEPDHWTHIWHNQIQSIQTGSVVSWVNKARVPSQEGNRGWIDKPTTETENQKPTGYHTPIN